MSTDLPFADLARFASSICLVVDDESFTYAQLIERVEALSTRYTGTVRPGDVVCLQGDFGFESVAWLLFLMRAAAIVVPITQESLVHRDEILATSRARLFVHAGAGSIDRLAETGAETGDGENHPLYAELAHRAHPGLVLFSSGSSGARKAAVHDLVSLAGKRRGPRTPKTVLGFLLFDHIGGLNTLFYVLATGGALVVTQDRTVPRIGALLERHRIAILPTTPTFCNLLLLHRAHETFDLASLEVISYGTEVMPEHTLQRMAQAFPHVTLQQTYGLSEVGILRARSESNQSVWMELGGKGVDLRIVSGILQVKTETTMLGYLDAAAPFTDDGWFVTGDRVETKGDYFRVLGRDSEIINVGGLKVYPTQVESALLASDDVLDAVVSKEDNVLLGQIATARIQLRPGADADEVRPRLRAFLRARLEKYEIPARFSFTTDDLFGPRQKRKRQHE